MTTEIHQVDFEQEPPTLTNQWRDDALLRDTLGKLLPPATFRSVEPHLDQVGADAVGLLVPWVEQAEREIPRHIPYNQFGKRIDALETSAAWKSLEAYSAQNGFVACGYEREHGEFSRVYQAALLYLFHPSSAFFTCPLAMTDGAARALELYGDKAQKERVLPHLLTRDPARFWTSGQWMTEKTGGSDVGLSRTVAEPAGDAWKLHGIKWFTSATTSQIAMTLARPAGAASGGKGLSLFMVETRDSAGALRNIEILRLKDKLGTKALPTAELRLDGTPAELVGGLGGGVRKISSLFNVTRIYNAICALGDMRRGLALAESYARKRFAFGKKLAEHGLHEATMRELRADFEKCLLFTFTVARLLGRDECGTASEDDRALLRLLTPLLKLYTGKKAVALTSEVLEVFGGQGYVEDSGLPRLLRNVQVFPIWEGTTNVLSLDLLRALGKEAPFEVFERGFRAFGPPAPLATRFQDFKTWLAGLGEEQRATEARRIALTMCELWTDALVAQARRK